MIRILATALIALSLTASGAFATSLFELVERDGIFYKKFTDEPFTGKLDEGAWRGAFKNGKIEGPWFSYHDNGQIRYKDEEREAPRVEHWENGQVGYKGAFKNGKHEGPWVVYHDNGQLADKGEFKNGKFEGTWIAYYDDGQLWSEGEYKNGKFEGPWVMYWSNGYKWPELSGTYRNGVRVSD